MILIGEENLRDRLIASQKTGLPLNVKAGFDPTAPDLRLEHTIISSVKRTTLVFWTLWAFTFLTSASAADFATGKKAYDQRDYAAAAREWQAAANRGDVDAQFWLGCPASTISSPVIDPHMGPHGTMYVVAMSKNGATYHHRLHALDLTTGAEEFGGPVEVQATYPGSGSGNVGGVLTFDPKQYKERAGLLLWNGTVYTSWASHCDISPYTGWVVGYNEADLTTPISAWPRSAARSKESWRNRSHRTQPIRRRCREPDHHDHEAVSNQT
jgi:hypothetical protein